jgi:drug/metabolite transporter (DMT)-like permease
MVLAYVVLGSMQDVYLARLFQTQNPLNVAFFSFVFATVIFRLVNLKSKTKKRLGAPVEFIKLNLVTAATWLTFFVALKYLEPAVVGAISFAMIPALSTVFTPVMRSKRPVTTKEYISASGVTLGLALLIGATITQNSSKTGMPTNDMLLGIFFAFVAAVGMTLNSFIVKDLTEKKFSALDILKRRFTVLIFVTGAFVFMGETPVFKPDLSLIVQMVFIAIIVVVIPMFLIQKAIERLEPIGIALFISFTPVVTFAFESFDSNLHLSAFTLAGVSICAVSSLYGVIRGGK